MNLPAALQVSTVGITATVPEHAVTSGEGSAERQEAKEGVHAACNSNARKDIRKHCYCIRTGPHQMLNPKPKRVGMGPTYGTIITPGLQ